MFKQIWAVLTNDQAARADHFDRNSHQQHDLPHMPDQSSVHCLVDDNLTTWVADPGFKEVNDLLGLHEADAQSWRGTPAQPFLDTSDQAQAAPSSALSTIDRDEPYHPSYQVVTTGPDHETSPSSTYDNVNPHDSVTEHFTRDVLPHLVWGGDYASYDMSSGQDLSHVDRSDIHANVYPCENGEFVGNSNFHGIDDPVSAGGQLSGGGNGSAHYGSINLSDGYDDFDNSYDGEIDDYGGASDSDYSDSGANAGD